MNLDEFEQVLQDTAVAITKQPVTATTEEIAGKLATFLTVIAGANGWTIDDGQKLVRLFGRSMTAMHFLRQMGVNMQELLREPARPSEETEA